MADQLTSDELRQVLADWISPYPPKQRRKIAGLFEAVIARAEAAEAEAEDAILAASDAAQREENAMHALSHFRARVAELEAQLAAQGWRPVTEDWPPYGVQHLGRAMLNSPTLLVTRTTDDSDEVWQDNDGMLFYGGDIRYCAAIPPLSDPQETPQ
jgi:hypothetical protein